MYALSANAGVFGTQQYRIYTRATAALFNDKQRGAKLSKLLNADQNILLDRQGEIQSAGASSYGLLSALADYRKKRNALPVEVRRNTPTAADQLRNVNLPPTAIGPTIATADAFAKEYPELVGFSGEYVEKRAAGFFERQSKGKSDEAKKEIEGTLTGKLDSFQSCSLEAWKISAGREGTWTNKYFRAVYARCGQLYTNL